MLELDLKTIVSKIMAEAKLSEQEVLSRVDKKVEELSSLVSRKGAAHIIATELGIKIAPTAVKQFVELNKLMPGLSNITVIGRVSNISQIRDFDKSGKKGRVANLLLDDGTASARLVFWNDHTNLIESSKFN